MTNENTGLIRSAIELDSSWRRAGFRFCFIGGMAVQRWGEPRVTRDLDLTLMAEFGAERPVIKQVLLDFEPRIRDAATFAEVNRILLVRDTYGTPIDIALGAMPFEDRSIERATNWEVAAGNSITTCSASDLVVHKAFANRDRDWNDVRGIIVRSPGAIDWDIVEQELRPLAELKNEPAILTRLEEIRK